MISTALPKADARRFINIHNFVLLITLLLLSIYIVFQLNSPKENANQITTFPEDNKGNQFFNEHHTLSDTSQVQRSPEIARHTNIKKSSVRTVQASYYKVLPNEYLLLDSSHNHPLEIGMVNVTDNKLGYRIGSGNRSIKLIAIRYDKEEIPDGYTAGDIHIYFYNETAKHWIQLKRDSIDLFNKAVYAVSTEDGDYINAVIKSPEAPETAGFAPTTLNDLQVGDPASMVQMIQPPTANNQGTASLIFHIETPKGRQNIEPNFAIAYNSDGNNGIMGEGWNLSGVSSIAVETRWGVPGYNTTEESETYLLDGKMLATADRNDKLNMAHRQLGMPRTGDIKRFFCRRENNFSKIERIGSIKNYIWVVTDKNGTQYYYGGIKKADQSNQADAVLSEGNKIAEWKLRKVEDLFGNSMEFTYETKEKIIDNDTVQSIYLKQVLYTLYKDNKQLKHVYKVSFSYDDTPDRKDFSFSARYGFLSSETASLLRSIKISSVDFRNDDTEDDSVSIRKYSFHYRYGSYSKIVLDSISQAGYTGHTEKPFYGQKFDYYSIDSLNKKYFSDEQEFRTADDLLGRSETKAKLGFGGAVGIGAPDFQFTSKSLSFDAQFSYKENESESTVSFIDIDGDGRPDIVTKKGSSIAYKPNTSSFNKISFGPERYISGLSGFGKDDGSSNGFGAEVNGPTQSRIYGGYDNNTTNSYSKSYFTDANGDGLIDVVDNGEVRFNTYDGSGGTIVFNKSSAKTPSPITSGANIGSTLVAEDKTRMDEELKNNIKISPLHDVVKIWIAPDSGTIRIDAPVNLVQPVLGPDDDDSAAYKKGDGVYVSVQQNSAYIFNPVKIEKGDTSEKPVSISSTKVKKGDKILFRVQSGNNEMANGEYDEVRWDPAIVYTSKDTNRHFIDPFSKNQFRYRAIEDHLYHNEVFHLPNSGSYTISGKFVKPSTKDAVTLTIKLSGSIFKDSVQDVLTVKRPAAEGGDTTINITKYNYTIKDSLFTKVLDTSAQIFATDFPVPQAYSYNTNISFEITPASNIDLTGIGWKPMINYRQYDTTETDPNLRWKKDSILYFPRMNFKGQLYKSGIFVKVKDSGDVRISPIIAFNNAANKKATLVISDKEKIIAKKQISGSSILTDTISFARNKGEFYTIHYEIESPSDIDTTLATGQIPSFLLIPNDYVNWIVPQTGLYSFFSTKKGALARSVISINGRDTLPHNRDTLANLFLKENDVISFPDTSTRIPVAFSTILTQASAVFHTWDIADYGRLYRGWGQASFNATNYLKKPIDIDKFRLSEVKRTNFYETEFFSMPQDVRTYRNTGVNKRIYINNDTLSASRMTMADVNPEKLFAVSSTINASGARAAVKYSRSTSHSVAVGGAGVTINKSFDGKSITYSDYIDLNGDRYPDIAGQSAVQFTNTLGGLRPTATPIDAGLQRTDASSSGINLGGVFFHPFLTTGKSANQKGNNLSAASSKLAAALAGLSGGYNDNNDIVQAGLFDVNGDGLPDKVNANGTVNINKGNGFSDKTIQWKIKSIQTNKSNTIGGGGSYNFDNNSGSAGINLAKTTTKQNSALIDFNGDGLIDNVISQNDEIIFYLNTGNAISDASTEVFNLGKSLDISNSISNSRGINGAFTFSPHIFAILVPICKIVFNISSNIGDGNNIVQSQWVDVNGDGFVDYVSYEKNTAKIRISQLGKINRLRKASGPLGGSFTFDYKHVKGDYKHPGGKWVMASLVKQDGVGDDGPDYKTAFDYEEGNYDRYEREFLGFKKTIATDHLKNKPYRRSVIEYNNQNYFIAHLAAKKWNEDTAGNKYQYEEYTYDGKYREKASITNVSVSPPSSLLGVAVVQNLLRSKTVYTFEGNSIQLMLNQTSYKYDSLLNVINYEYKEGNNAIQQERSFYKADITYRKIERTPYLYGLPTSIVVKNKAGTTLKKEKANYPLGVFKNKMKSDTVFFSDKDFAATEYKYDDQTGNLIKKTYANGLLQTFEFEDRLATYISRIVDPYGLENRFDYDYRFGTEIVKTLTSGASIKTKYDEFGRIIKVQGPHQNSTDIEDADHTIKLAYSISPGASYSIVKHFDEANENDGIYTINFVDGFGKNIQIKKTSVVNGAAKWVVSGRQFHDGLYRLARSYYPTIQNYDVLSDMQIGNTGTSLKSDTNKIAATVTGYDILDRNTSTRLPNAKLFESNTYSIKKDGFNNEAQATVTTYGNDARLNKKEKFTNGAGLVTTEKYYPVAGNDAICKTTKYQYTPVHLVDSIYNVNNNTQYLVIANSYDWNGRRKNYYNISAGTTSYEYDKLNNLKRRINARKDSIEYDYEHQRLIRVRYPRHPEDSVRYIYGEKTGPATANNAGRVVFQVDATGAQSFTYDSYGNIAFNTRTIVAPFDTTYTFTSQFTYDSWGRLKKMVYPSGESVKYNYNIAGNLVKVAGSKYGTDDVSFPYVNNITYDEFEQRKAITYGNKLVTIYTYEDTLRRLSSLQTLKDGTEIMLSTYKYDELNNIKLNQNKSSFAGMNAVNMNHEYAYDNQNQLILANGNWNTSTTYKLDLSYDDQFSIKTKTLDLVSPQITRNINSQFQYKENNPLQLHTMKDRIKRKNLTTNKTYKELNTAFHNYDEDGNDVLTNMADSFHSNVQERKICWDQENRIRAISTNGYLSSYTYDANGTRTIKISNETEGVYINGQFAGDFTSAATYSLYVSPYFSVRNAKGIGTKHIYIGEERIVSQLTNYTSWPVGNEEISARHPERDTLTMTINLVPKNKFVTVGYLKKMAKTEALINSYYDSLQLPHKTILHNAFKKNWPALNYPIVADPAQQFLTGNVINQVDGNEKLQYFYHRNHIGSSSFISDKDQTIVQYVEYLPFGETFMETRKDYSSQFLFNGKEQDQETGLYYYGARYYDPQTYQWLGVDPMCEKNPGYNPYGFCLNNPIRRKDEIGHESEDEVAKQSMNVGNSYFLYTTFYDGLLRMDYNQQVSSLEPLYEKYNPNGISNALGRELRYDIKLTDRAKTTPVLRGVLNEFKPVQRSPIFNEGGEPTRFFKTSVGANRLAVGLGALSAASSISRIYNAPDRLKETGRVFSGFAGAAMGAAYCAPYVFPSSIFICGPFAPICAGVAEFGCGVGGAFLGEKLFDMGR